MASSGRSREQERVVRRFRPGADIEAMNAQDLASVRDELRRWVDRVAQPVLDGPVAANVALETVQTQLETLDPVTDADQRRHWAALRTSLCDKDISRDGLAAAIDACLGGPGRPDLRDRVDPEVHDALIKDIILLNKNLSPLARRMEKERPSVFANCCSAYNYDETRFNDLLDRLRNVADGHLTQQDAYMETFHRHIPNSNAVIQAMQREAMLKQATNEHQGSVNLQ